MILGKLRLKWSKQEVGMRIMIYHIIDCTIAQVANAIK